MHNEYTEYRNVLEYAQPLASLFDILQILMGITRMVFFVRMYLTARPSGRCTKMQKVSEVCHEKTHLKVFVIVIPMTPTGMTLTFREYDP